MELIDAEKVYIKISWDCPFTVREHSNDDKLEKSVATFKR
jgi:hypothetical protein